MLDVKSNEWNNPCGTGCNLVALMRGLIVSAASALWRWLLVHQEVWFRFVGALAPSVSSQPVVSAVVSCVDNRVRQEHGAE